MGKVIRKRTPEEQKVHDKVILLLLAGESSRQIADDYQLEYSTVRNWKARARRKQEKALQSSSDALRQYNEKQSNLPPTLNKNGTLSVENIKINEAQTPAVATDGDSYQPVSTEQHEQLGDSLKGLLLSQANVAIPSLMSLREGIGGSVVESSQALSAVISQAASLLKEKKTDDITGVENELTAPELRLLLSIIKDASKTFADLHLLPFGAQKSAPLKFSDAVPPQHLHLHSHGQRSQPKAIDAGEALRPVIAEESPEPEPVAVRNDMDELQQLMLDEL